MTDQMDLGIARQHAMLAGRGSLSDLRTLLRALVDGAVYREYAGNPNSNIIPDSIGELCLDTTNDDWYRSNGLLTTDWVLVGFSSEVSRRTHSIVFDDFTYETLATTGVGRGDWIVFAGSDGDATAAAVVAGVPEGQILMGSGDGGTTNDGSVLSLILLSQGALVSLGTTIFECRAAFDQITGVTACFGLSDTLATTAEHLLHTITAGTVADGGLSVTNTVEFVYSEEATAGTLWHAASENAGTIGNSGAEETLTDGPTADTYDTLRLEVDADGTARFYINGVLRLTRASAVATTALLIPYIAIDGEAATPVVTDLSIDYIYFAAPRPSSNA